MDTAPPSFNGCQVSLPFADVRQLCQLQLDRLGEKLPLLDVWLVCWSQIENKRDMIAFQGDHGTHPQIRSYLGLERWICNNLPFLEPMPLCLESGNSQVYGGGLGKTKQQNRSLTFKKI